MRFGELEFDGASRIDMLFLPENNQALPFEIKLGSTRLIALVGRTCRSRSRKGLWIGRTGG
jgi:hypothetical protein